MLKRQSDTARRRSLADYDVKGKIFHGGVQDFLNAAVETVYLVDKQHISLAKICQQRRKIALLFNGGAACNAEVYPKLRGDNAGKRGFAKSRRAVQQYMVEGVAAHFSRVDINFQDFLSLFLPDIFVKGMGPQSHLRVRVLFCDGGFHYSVFKIKIVYEAVQSGTSLTFHKLCERQTDKLLRRKRSVKSGKRRQSLAARISEYGKSVPCVRKIAACGNTGLSCRRSKLPFCGG